jgi:mono/diheme cytochrome c family protein
MKKGKLKLLAIVTISALLMSFSLTARAQDAAAAFKTRCAMCHGADGSKMAAHNLQSAEVQKMSDGDIADTITNGKGRMPGSRSLKPEDVKGIVSFVRTLKR